MKKKIFFALLMMIIMVAMAVPVAAASITRLPQVSYQTYKADITGDGKADQIQLVLTSNSSCVTKIVFKVNGKTSYTMNNLHCYESGIRLVVVKMSKEKVFLLFRAKEDNQFPIYQRVLQYDKTKKKLIKVLDLDNYTGQADHVSAVTSNSFTMNYRCDCYLTGFTSFDLKYVYNSSTGKFAVSSSTPVAKQIAAKTTNETNGRLYGSPADYFGNGKYTTVRSVQAYKDKNCTKKAFVIPAGKTVKLQKVYVTKKSDWQDRGIFSVCFKFGKNTCWIQNDVQYMSDRVFNNVPHVVAGSIIRWYN